MRKNLGGALKYFFIFTPKFGEDSQFDGPHIFLPMGGETPTTKELWNLIDVGTGEIAVNQFAQGLRIISEETKAKDVFAINRRVGNAAYRLDSCVS